MRLSSDTVVHKAGLNRRCGRIVRSLVFSAAVLCVYLSLDHFHAWRYVGVGSLGRGLADLQSRLARIDAYRDGVPYSENYRYDYVGRKDTYPPTWGFLSYLGLARGQERPIAICLFSFFLFTVFYLTNVTTLVEIAYVLLFLLSPSVLLGVERGNIDFFLFAITSIFFLCISSRHEIVRRVSVVWPILGATLKIYPIILMGVYFLNNTRRTFLRFVGVSVLLVVASDLFFQFNVSSYVQSIYERSPKPYSSDSYGLKMIYYGLFYASYFRSKYAYFVMLLIPFLVVVSVVLGRSMKERLRDFTVSQVSMQAFSAALLVTVFCYLVTTNYNYRAIYLLLCLPLVFEVLRSGKLRALCHLSLISLLTSMCLTSISLDICICHDDLRCKLFLRTVKSVLFGIGLVPLLGLYYALEGERIKLWIKDLRFKGGSL